MFNNDADTNEDVVGTSEQVFVGEDYKEDDGSLNEGDEGQEDDHYSNYVAVFSLI